MDNKKAILVVSFGTSFPDARENAIGGVETALGQAFPEYEVRRCFTSGMVIRHINNSEGIHIDNPQEALERAVSDGVLELVIQPTHVMDGFECQKFMKVLDEYREKFETVKVGSPLLSEPQDYQKLIGAVTNAVDGIAAEENDSVKKFGNTAVILIGHGSETEADRVYAELQKELRAAGYNNYYVGTIESHPCAAEILESIRCKEYKKIVLLPLMVVAGDHAINDIAGGKDESTGQNPGPADSGMSWRQVFEAAGYEVFPVMKGLGEYPEIQSIYTEHLWQALV